jgi:hypothetical protein
MGLIMSKAEKEQRKKMVVKKSMNDLRKRISTLERQKANHIESA